MPADRITPPPSPQHALHLIEILLRTYVPKNTPDWQAWQAAVAILKAQLPSGVNGNDTDAAIKRSRRRAAGPAGDPR